MKRPGILVAIGVIGLCPIHRGHAADSVPTMVAPDVDVNLIREAPAADVGEKPTLRPERRGIYFRIAAGPGLFWALSEGPTERHFTAKTLSLSAAMGGTLLNRVVIGGVLASDRAFGLEGVDEHDEQVDLEGVRFDMVSVGPFIEVYPDIRGGLHFGLGALLGVLNVDRRINEQSVEADGDPTGFSFMLSAGYEWRAASKLHLGALARLLYAPLDVDEIGTKVDVTVWVPALLLSATIH